MYAKISPIQRHLRVLAGEQSERKSSLSSALFVKYTFCVLFIFVIAFEITVPVGWALNTNSYVCETLWKMTVKKDECVWMDLTNTQCGHSFTHELWMHTLLWQIRQFSQGNEMRLKTYELDKWEVCSLIFMYIYRDLKGNKLAWKSCFAVCTGCFWSFCYFSLSLSLSLSLSFSPLPPPPCLPLPLPPSFPFPTSHHYTALLFGVLFVCFCMFCSVFCSLSSLCVKWRVMPFVFPSYCKHVHVSWYWFLELDTSNESCQLCRNVLLSSLLNVAETWI